MYYIMRKYHLYALGNHNKTIFYITHYTVLINNTSYLEYEN